jgi:hypothetical protein
MSRRVLPKGLIMGQPQSDTGAPTIGGIGARTISNRRAIKINAVHPVAEIPYIPMVKNLQTINQGVIIYLSKLQRNMTYQYLIEGTNNILNATVNVSSKSIQVTGLTNSTNNTVKLRAVNSYNEKSDWLDIININPSGTIFNLTTGNGTFQPPTGVTVTYLIVGGGGGAGGSYDTGAGGGGGGGMVLYGQFIATGMVYTANVGVGGAGGIGENNGSSGGSSSISGIGVALGGGGGFKSREGPFGQGGTKAIAPATASTGGKGSGSDAELLGSGGGGGSSGDGETATGNIRGAGGAGTAVTIGNISGVYGVGGGGRNGNDNTSNGNQGAANTGNGGQGASSNSSDQDNGGNGGSGVVIAIY